MIVGNKTFKTKKECEETIRKLIYEIGVCTDVKNELIYDFVKLHYNWEQDGLKMKTVGIEQCEQYLRILYYNHDGTTTVISWKACLTGKPNVNTIFTEALRTTVLYQIDEYRKTCKIWKCDFCESNQNLQVDHVYEFKNIKKDFMTEYNIVIPETYKKITHNLLSAFEDKDVELETKWKEYHQKKSQYRLLCRTCNIGRNKK